MRLCSCRVWWLRWVVRAEWAVINLFGEKEVSNVDFVVLDLEQGDV